MVISAQIVTTPMNKRFMMYLTMQHSSRSGFFSSEEAAERSVPDCLFAPFYCLLFYNASSPALAGTNPDDVCHFLDKNLSVSDISGTQLLFQKAF